jgi:hypothetical protein
MAPMFVKPVRRLVIGSTGYGLFYSLEARGIIVHALVHLSRNPEKSASESGACLVSIEHRQAACKHKRIEHGEMFPVIEKVFSVAAA